eukprot:m.102251 g.102251  ORF g.102251 m.102251 type:complete len:439 (+) comp20796_c0_seq1:89-1405(+)
MASKLLQQRGWAVIRNALPKGLPIREWADDVFALGMLSSGRGLDDVWHHYENVAGPRKTVLTRSENFASNHAGMKGLLMAADSPVAAVVGDTYGKPVTLYKEKINYKQSGGGGYVAHQDAPAYRELKQHVTCLCPIDPMDEENGCLEFASGEWDRLLETTDDGVIAPSVADNLTWTAAPLDVGDVVVFSSYVPHRSLPNLSNRPRRALYLTFNATEDGEFRTAYYENKAKSMAHDRLSIINHFDGDLVLGANEVVAAVRDLFAHRGDTMYDPQVSQLEHGLQSAEIARAADPTDHEMITAALLHDVGHLILDEHDSDSEFLEQNLEHEAVGHTFLKSRFSERVAAISLNHVDAKRYLCGTNAAYYDGLSSASKRSLELQGGPFVPDECKAFETRPFAMDAVQVRQWDDQAKVGGMSTAGLESFMPHVEAAAKAASATM